MFLAGNKMEETKNKAVKSKHERKRYYLKKNQKKKISLNFLYDQIKSKCAKRLNDSDNYKSEPPLLGHWYQKESANLLVKREVSLN